MPSKYLQGKKPSCFEMKRQWKGGQALPFFLLRFLGVFHQVHHILVYFPISAYQASRNISAEVIERKHVNEMRGTESRRNVRVSAEWFHHNCSHFGDSQRNIPTYLGEHGQAMP